MAVPPIREPQPGYCPDDRGATALYKGFHGVAPFEAVKSRYFQPTSKRDAFLFGCGLNGEDAIPLKWRQTLAKRELIVQMADRLFQTAVKS